MGVFAFFGAFGPRIDLVELLAVVEALRQCLTVLQIIDDLLLDPVQTDFGDPFIGAVQVLRAFAVELVEGAGDFDGLFFGGDLHQKICFPKVQTGSAADEDLIAAVHTDDAEVFAGGLSSVAGAAADRELEFMRRPCAPHGVLDLDAKAGAVLRAKAAML